MSDVGKRRARQRRYEKRKRGEDPAAFRAKTNRYYAKNSEKIKAKRRAAYAVDWLDEDFRRKATERAVAVRRKRREDPAFRAIESLQTRMRLAVVSKAAGTMELVGCSPQFLRGWLEAKFKPGMTWNNHGLRGWHIDHIRPCASFDLTDPNQQRACFHYTNLQPLWWRENIQKGAR